MSALGFSTLQNKRFGIFKEWTAMRSTVGITAGNFKRHVELLLQKFEWTRSLAAACGDLAPVVN